MTHLLLRAFRLHPNRNYEILSHLLIQKLYTDVGNGMTIPGIRILATLLITNS